MTTTPPQKQPVMESAQHVRDRPRSNANGRFAIRGDSQVESIWQEWSLPDWAPHETRSWVESPRVWLPLLAWVHDGFIPHRAQMRSGLGISLPTDEQNRREKALLDKTVDAAIQSSKQEATRSRTRRATTSKEQENVGNDLQPWEHTWVTAMLEIVKNSKLSGAFQGDYNDDHYGSAFQVLLHAFVDMEKVPPGSLGARLLPVTVGTSAAPDQQEDDEDEDDLPIVRRSSRPSLSIKHASPVFKKAGTPGSDESPSPPPKRQNRREAASPAAVLKARSRDIVRASKVPLITCSRSAFQTPETGVGSSQPTSPFSITASSPGMVPRFQRKRKKKTPRVSTSGQLATPESVCASSECSTVNPPRGLENQADNHALFAYAPGRSDSVQVDTDDVPQPRAPVAVMVPTTQPHSLSDCFEAVKDHIERCEPKSFSRHQPEPIQVRIAALEARVKELEARLAATEGRHRPMDTEGEYTNNLKG